MRIIGHRENKNNIENNKTKFHHYDVCLVCVLQRARDMYEMAEASTCGPDEHVEQLTVSALPTSNEGKSILSLIRTESLLDKLHTPKPSEISRKWVIHCNPP